MTPDLLTLGEVAAALRVSVRTVHRLIANGQLRPTRIGRRTLVTRKEVEAFVSAAYRSVA